MPRAAWVVAALSVATALTALAPAGDGPRATAHDASRPAAVRPVTGAGAAAQVGTQDTGTQDTGAQDTGAVTSAPRPPTAGADVPRAAVATMSFDEPIQGGLTAHQAQAASAAILRAHTDVGLAPASPTWTPAMGRTALARARSWLGMPYSWAAGAANGPTAGRCDPTNGAGLDCHIVGFDCSGLTAYAWGAYTALPHLAQTQRDAGQFHPTVAQLQPGDLVFFSGYLPDGIGHVAVYDGGGTVIEAPQSGAVVRRSTLAELMAHDGTYRGAVRPLTPATPTLTVAGVRAPRAGGALTLRGTGLAGVTSVTVGSQTHRITAGSDTAIRIGVPRAATGARAVTVTLTTSWGATSQPVALAYADPVVSRPVTQPPAPKPTPTTPAPVKPAPTKPAPTKPTPAPTSGPTSATSSIQAVPAPVAPDGSVTSGAAGA